MSVSKGNIVFLIMHRIGHLYETLLDKERIKEIIILASRKKTHRQSVRHVIENVDHYADLTLQMLESNTFWLRPPTYKTITENGKTRELTVSPFFPNRVLDYVMVETIKPAIKKSMYEYCIGNVDGRGISFGKRAISKVYKKYKYYLKLDIHKFYPSVDSANLVDFMQSKIKDQRFMNFARYVVLSCPDLPIGSYYSQWFSNWYLEDLDHSIKEEWHIPFYVRYVDDMLLLGNNKRVLMNAMYKINARLKEKGLSLKRFEVVRTLKDGPIDFLGFRFGEHGIDLRTRTFKKLNHKIRKIAKTNHASISQAQSAESYISWLKQTPNGYRYYSNHIKPDVPNGYLKWIISNDAKQKNKQRRGELNGRSKNSSCSYSGST